LNPFSLKAPARSVAFRLKKGCKKWRSQPDGGAVKSLPEPVAVSSGDTR
jgi:hypothetical protein